MLSKWLVRLTQWKIQGVCIGVKNIDFTPIMDENGVVTIMVDAEEGSKGELMMKQQNPNCWCWQSTRTDIVVHNKFLYYDN